MLFFSIVDMFNNLIALITFYWLFLDNMPVTWCYQLEDERQYCSTGFPMGCYSKESRSQQDTCTIHVNTQDNLSSFFKNYKSIKLSLFNEYLFTLGSI